MYHTWPHIFGRIWPVLIVLPTQANSLAPEPAQSPHSEAVPTHSLPAIRVHAQAQPTHTLASEAHAHNIDLSEQVAPPTRLEALLAEHGLAAPAPSGAADLFSSVQIRGFTTGGEPGTGLSASRHLLGPHPDISRRHVRDLSTVDSVTLLQGPSATRTGLGSAAGVVQYVPKTAQDRPNAQASLLLDDRSTVRATADINLPLWQTQQPTASPTLATRLVLAGQTGGRSTEGVRTDREVVYWTTRLREPDALWDLTLEQQTNHQPFGFGTVFANEQWQFDKSYVDVQRATAKRQYQRVSLLQERELGQSTLLTAWLSNVRTKRDEHLIGFWDVSSPDTLSGYRRAIDESSQAKHHGLMLEHHSTETLSWQLSWQRNQQHLRFSGPQNVRGFEINMQVPSFTHVDLETLLLSPLWWRERLADHTTALHADWQPNPRWRLQAGVSRTAYTVDRVTSRLATEPTLLSPLNHDRVQGHALTLTHLWPQGHQSWLGHTQGFEPNQGGFQRDGTLLPALKSSQWELGLRAPQYQEGDGNSNDNIKPLGWFVVLWHNQQRHVAGPDPQDRQFLVPVGTVGGHGVQLTLEQQRSGWRWRAAYNQSNVRTLTNANPSAGPWRPGMADQWLAAQIVATGHPFQPWLGLQTVGSRPADTYNRIKAPGFAVLNTGVNWTINPQWRLQAEVNNLLDKRYISSLQSPDAAWQGPRRTASLTLHHQIRH